MTIYGKHLKEPTTDITPEINRNIAKLKDTQVNCFPIEPHKYSELIVDKGVKENKGL